MKTLQHIKQNHWHGTVIDSDGREVPISEAMILDACRALDTLSLGPRWLPHHACRGDENSQSITGTN